MSASAESRASAIVAAVDVGSNTIKMTVARKAGDDLDELRADAQTVRLSAGIEESGQIDSRRVEMALACLRRFAAEARVAGATVFIGVATEVLRIAGNGEEILARVAAETPWCLRVISGEEEARLTYAGVRPSLADVTSAIVADIGGGSTELIAASRGAATGFVSVPVGSGRLTDRLIRTDPPTSGDLRACREAAIEAFRAARFAAPLPLERLSVTGGTGLYLAALVGADEHVVPSRLGIARRTLLGFPSTSVSESLRLPLERAKVLPAGLAVVEGMIQLWEPRELQMTASGIRRGLLLNCFAGDLRGGEGGDPPRPPAATSFRSPCP